MEISPALQARLLLYSFILGLVLGALFDLAWLVCRSVGARRAVRAVLRVLLDILLCLTAGCGFVLLCYYFNDGVQRSFAALGVILGLVGWRVTLSRLSRLVLGRLLLTAFSVIRFFLTPIFKIFKFLVNNLKKLVYSIYKALAKSVNIVYNVYVKKYVLARAKNGFLKNGR